MSQEHIIICCIDQKSSMIIDYPAGHESTEQQRSDAGWRQGTQYQRRPTSSPGARAV